MPVPGLLCIVDTGLLIADTYDHLTRAICDEGSTVLSLNSCSTWGLTSPDIQVLVAVFEGHTTPQRPRRQSMTGRNWSGCLHVLPGRHLHSSTALDDRHKREFSPTVNGHIVSATSVSPDGLPLPPSVTGIGNTDHGV